MVFPRPIARSLQAVIDDPAYVVPSPSTVSHARFCFDMALLLYQRDMFTKMFQELGPRPCLLGMTDSSPMGQYNWQNTSFQMIKGSLLRQFGQTARRLASRVRATAADCTEDDERDIQFLESAARKFTCTCTGLGTKQAGLGHKQHAVWHQLFMMTGTPQLLRRVSGCVEVWTVDLGVESKMNNAAPASFEKICHTSAMLTKTWPRTIGKLL